MPRAKIRREKIDTKIIPDVLISAFNPKPRIPPSEWARENIRIPDSVSKNRGGPLVLQSHFASIFDTLTEEPDVTIRTIRSCIRIGKTTFAIAVALYNAYFIEQNVIYYTSKQELCDEIQSITWKIIKESPAFRGTVVNQKDGIIELKSGIKIWFKTASNPKNFEGLTAGCVLLDELDSLKKSVKKEGSLIRLAEGRTESFPLTRNIWLMGKPTVDSGNISVEYKRSRSHKWKFPCPFCKEEVEPLFDQIDEMNGLSDAELEERKDHISWNCPKCKGRLTYPQFANVREKGRYVLDEDQESKASHRTSYHISGLQSHYYTFYRIISEYRETKKDRTLIPTFENQILGIPSKIGTKKLDNAAILAALNRTIDSSKREAPDDTLEIMIAADTGAGEKGIHFYPVAAALRPNRKVTILNCDVRYGEEGLKDFISQSYRTKDGREIKPSYVYLDSGDGNVTEEIKTISKKNPGIYPLKGIKNGTDLCWFGRDRDRETDLFWVSKQKSMAHFFTALEMGWLEFSDGLPMDYFKGIQTWAYSEDKAEYVELVANSDDEWIDSTRYVLAALTKSDYREVEDWDSVKHLFKREPKKEEPKVETETPKQRPKPPPPPIINPYGTKRGGISPW